MNTEKIQLPFIVLCEQFCQFPSFHKVLQAQSVSLGQCISVTHMMLLLSLTSYKHIAVPYDCCESVSLQLQVCYSVTCMTVIQSIAVVMSTQHCYTSDYGSICNYSHKHKLQCYMYDIVIQVSL